LKGRPPKLTKRLIRGLGSALEAGNYVSTACALVGIHKSTYYAWHDAAGRDDATPLLREFSDVTRRATARSEARDLAVIGKAAGRGVWQAAAWRLERKFPLHWRVDVRDVLERELRVGVERIVERFPPAMAMQILACLAGEPRELEQSAAIDASAAEDSIGLPDLGAPPGRPGCDTG
jgi:hypothetical protein